MEFAYRTLIDTYGFSADNIYVLNYDGTRKVWTSLSENGPGTTLRTQYRSLAKALAGVPSSNRRPFVEDSSPRMCSSLTNNHGDFDTSVNDSFLCGWVNDVTNPPPNSDGDFDYYYATDFAADLSALPAYRALMVLIEQCNSGGFNRFRS